MIVEKEYICKNNIIVEVHQYGEEGGVGESYFNTVVFDATNMEKEDLDWDLTNNIITEEAFSTLEEADKFAKELVEKYGLVESH